MFKGTQKVSSIYKGSKQVQEIKKGLTTIYEAFNTTTLSGALPLTFEKSAGKKLKDYKIYGNSVQNGTPTPEAPIEVESVGDKTKNLAEKLTNLNSSGTSVTSTILLKETSKFVNSSLIKVTPGKKYTLSKTNQGNDFRYFWFDTEPILSQTQSIGGEYLLFNSTKYTITAPDTAQYLFVRWSEGYDAGNVQIEEGNSATEFEPYGYKIPVTIQGKNLLDIPTIDNTTPNTIINCRLTKPFIVSCQEYPSSIKNDNGADASVWRFKFKYLDGTLNYTVDNSLKGVTGFTNTYTASEDNPVIEVEYRSIYIREGAYKGIQIEYGSTATAYEPYVEPITTNIYLDEPLRKIGNYADYIDFVNKKVVRNIKYLELDQTNNWSKYTSMDNHYQVPVTNNYFNINENYVFSNYYIENKVNGAYYSTLNYAVMSVDGNRIRFKNKDISTVQEWKEWLSSLETPLYVLYRMTTPEEQQIDLPAILTNKNTNIIDIETHIKPNNIEITYLSKK